jgi:hypothetical protein
MSSEDHPVPQREVIDDPPPFLGNWPRVYAAVLLYLLCIMSALFLLTRIFSAA